MGKIERIRPKMLPYADFAAADNAPWMEVDRWPCSWIGPESVPPSPFAAVYHCAFELTAETTIDAHVTADERYELFVDGERVGRGSERGEKSAWHYETYRMTLSPGRHHIGAIVFSLGAAAPWAQTTVRHGFLFSPDKKEFWDLLGSGRAQWRVQIADGIEYLDLSAQCGSAIGIGPGYRIDASRFPYDAFIGKGDLQNTVSFASGNNGDILYRGKARHRLSPSPLPAMDESPIDAASFIARYADDARAGSLPAVPCTAPKHDIISAWDGLLRGTPVTIEKNSRHRVIIDLGEYRTGTPVMHVLGGKGSRISVRWAECMSSAATGGKPQRRDAVDDHYFIGIGDEFISDGNDRTFRPFWWRAGRFLEIGVDTADDALTIRSLVIETMQYPLAVSGHVSLPIDGWDAFSKTAVRTLRACLQESFTDCPYYEQLMYLGDSRLQALLTMMLSGDDRLLQKAVYMAALSRDARDGFTASSAPSNAGQLIAPFSLWWVVMIVDLARMSGDSIFIRSLMPALRQVMETWLLMRGDSGLAVNPNGWNYVDWVAGLDGRGDSGNGAVRGSVNWQIVYTLSRLSELDAWLGEHELAARWKRIAEEMTAAIDRVFWDDTRRAWAEDSDHTLFSEHAQSLAILSGMLSEDRVRAAAHTLAHDASLTRATIYFSHYVFEALLSCGHVDTVIARFAPWLALSAEGYSTTPENFGGGRSECHAWGAHPLWHAFSGILGISYDGFGGTRFRIRPQLGSLPSAEGTMAHPNGPLTVRVCREGEMIRADIVVPSGVTVLVEGNRFQETLAAGSHTLYWRENG